MRFVKTILREIRNDIKSIFSLFNIKVILFIAGVVSWAVFVVWFACFLETVVGLLPGEAAPVSIFSSLAVTALILWIVNIVIRARKRIKYENTQILNTIKGNTRDQNKYN